MALLYSLAALLLTYCLLVAGAGPSTQHIGQSTVHVGPTTVQVGPTTVNVGPTTQTSEGEADIVTDAPTSASRTVDTPFQVYTQALGRSGKIRVSSNANFTDEETIVIELDSLTEIGSDGSQLKGGRHSFPTIANQNFEISELTNGTYMNLSCQSFNLTTSLMKRLRGVETLVGRVSVTIYVFSEAGNMSVDGERTTVNAGTVKFNIQMDDYMFCDQSDSTCKSKIGDALDMTMIVKGYGGASAEKANKMDGEDVDIFSLGGNSSLRISSKVNVDGEWKDMPEGYPLVEQVGSKQLLRCRFPKFNSRAIYDPQIDLAVAGLVNDDGSSSAQHSRLSVTLACILFVVCLMLF